VITTRSSIRVKPLVGRRCFLERSILFLGFSTCYPTAWGGGFAIQLRCGATEYLERGQLGMAVVVGLKERLLGFLSLRALKRDF
jgi:hypothetical protein